MGKTAASTPTAASREKTLLGVKSHRTNAIFSDADSSAAFGSPWTSREIVGLGWFGRMFGAATGSPLRVRPQGNFDG